MSNIIVINAVAGAQVAKNGHATYPDDFPRLSRDGGDFTAWKEFFDPRWHVETTLDGEALKQKLKELEGLSPNESKEWRAKTSAEARCMAFQTWGKVESQFKLAPGLWLYSTPSHGGIVADTYLRPELRKYNRQLVSGKSLYSSKQHYAAMEEDCMAAVAEWLYANEICTPKYKRRFRSELTLEEWTAQRITLLRQSLEQWNPDVLKEYPSPSMGAVAVDY